MVTQDSHPLARLTLRGRRIIEHVVRDRLTTNEAVQALFFENSHPTSVTRTTAELCAQGWLVSFPLVYPTKYFRLGKRAASGFGLSLHATYPLGPQALPTEYALLRYTSTNHHKLRRLSSQELLSRHPWQKNSWLHAPHCLRCDADRSITELIRVDLGASPDHIARKCQTEINDRFLVDEFRTLLTESRFQLVVITGSTQKAAQIDAALSAHNWPAGMRFRIAVFSDLIPLLPRCF